jgi:4-amino-4-deoxychorismate lyase
VEGAFRQGDLKDVRLIETLGWDGADFPRLDLHLGRLGASAARFGWACDLRAAERTLREAVPAGPARMRLTLDAEAQVAVTASAMPAPARRWRVSLASEALDADDPWLTLKSTRRAAYDAARAALAPGIDEAILTNTAGGVCDGTITTVFFDAGDGLCTPPRSAGLLPGVLRAEMLALGRCREAPLMAADVPRVRLWVGNSLRGLIPAVWAGG